MHVDLCRTTAHADPALSSGAFWFIVPLSHGTLKYFATLFRPDQLQTHQFLSAYITSNFLNQVRLYSAALADILFYRGSDKCDSPTAPPNVSRHFRRCFCSAGEVIQSPERSVNVLRAPTDNQSFVASEPITGFILAQYRRSIRETYL